MFAIEKEIDLQRKRNCEGDKSGHSNNCTKNWDISCGGTKYSGTPDKK